MKYEGSVYRPPSEAHSLIIQATIGCSHNKCTFCSMYKDKRFRMRKTSEIIDDLKEAAAYYPQWRRVFLADGDALIMPTNQLAEILKTIKKLFPGCERVGIYGSPQSIALKTPEDLELLKSLGLGIVYLGVETGSDRLLEAIKKGVKSDELLAAGLKVRTSGLALSVMLISGIGGTTYSKEHAEASAKLMAQMNPDYLSLLTLLLEDGTELYQDYKSGDFKLLNSMEVLEETRLFLESLGQTKSVFRANHASNYVNLKGDLPQDKLKLLAEIDSAMKHVRSLKSERYRSL